LLAICFLLFASGLGVDKQFLHSIFGILLLVFAACFENRSIGFQRHSSFEVHAIAYNRVSLRSMPNRDYRLRALFCVAMNANTCIALNSKQCTWVAFNFNASLELEVIRLVPFPIWILSQKYLLWPQSKWWRWYRRNIGNEALVRWYEGVYISLTRELHRYQWVFISLGELHTNTHISKMMKTT